jgi:drug/metabolite transporter (DMT)-like permease
LSYSVFQENISLLQFGGLILIILSLLLFAGISKTPLIKDAILFAFLISAMNTITKILTMENDAFIVLLASRIFFIYPIVENRKKIEKKIPFLKEEANCIFVVFLSFALNIIASLSFISALKYGNFAITIGIIQTQSIVVFLLSFLFSKIGVLPEKEENIRKKLASIIPLLIGIILLNVS